MRELEEIAEELVGPHDYVEGDEWYSCGMAITPGEPERPGCSDESKRGRCGCRRSERAAEILAALREAADAARQEERKALRRWLVEVGAWASQGAVLAWLDARSRAEEPKPE